MSVQEILYPRCILGHKIGGFRASECLSKKHECLSQEYFIMQIMDTKIKKLLLTLQKQTIGCMQSKKMVFSVENKRKKKALVLNQVTYHTQNRTRILLSKFSKRIFPLKLRIKHQNQKERRNRTLLLFSSLWSSVYILYTEKTSRSSTYERPRC